MPSVESLPLRPDHNEGEVEVRRRVQRESAVADVVPRATVRHLRPLPITRSVPSSLTSSIDSQAISDSRNPVSSIIARSAWSRRESASLPQHVASSERTWGEVRTAISDGGTIGFVTPIIGSTLMSPSA